MPDSGATCSRVPAIASCRFICPSTTFRHVGELESSKSAMNTLAPELSALMIVFRSVGPVISTRRSWRPAGMGATVHSLARISSVEERKFGRSSAS